MRLALALILIFLSGCVGSRSDNAIDQSGSYWTAERKAMYQQALEGARLSRERYIVVERPALQLKLRQEYPSLNDAEIEALVDDALEREVRAHAGRQPDGTLRQRQMDCMSPAWRNSVFANCP